MILFFVTSWLMAIQIAILSHALLILRSITNRMVHYPFDFNIFLCSQFSQELGFFKLILCQLGPLLKVLSLHQCLYCIFLLVSYSSHRLTQPSPVEPGDHKKKCKKMLKVEYRSESKLTASFQKIDFGRMLQFYRDICHKEDQPSD